ncbi:hypothetical protein LFT44_12530 [Arthrobacter sp. FW306-05-C]|uniref:hypothetical protein n=1 Tax=unclassified Arthrobacter TaxID=235627 RepID=UPI001EF0FE24|nr:MULTISPECIES: hypothetical protein [unclassified Arthrobacter]UKA68868.1 hypothetical protein LFT44_12530 [Arthrobacter sp. FW306-05-C]UKA73205.1 hypothetical protein LFT49_13305 [Arthrobacter sp. FW306-06-A]
MLLGLLTLLAGIGQRTIWAPSETFTASAPADAAAAPLTVIDQKLRTLHGGTVKINIQGDGNFMLASGRPDDVNAWVGKTAHNTISGVSEDEKSLQVDHTDGDAAAPNPAGSDLWVSSENAGGELEYTWTPPADGEWTLLLASDGTKPAPASVSMTFPNDTSTPWAVPLMVLGSLLIVAGIVLALLAARRKNGEDAGDSTDGDISDGGSSSYARRARARKAKSADAGSQNEGSLNPDTSNAGNQNQAPSSSSSKVTMVAAAVAAAVLAGSATAAQAATPSPQPSGSASSPAKEASGLPVLLDAQFRRILEQVSSATDAGDAAKDAAKLAGRVGGPELEIRTQNYKIRSQVGSYEPRMPVRSTKLLTYVVTSDRNWPRSVLAVTQGEGNVVPQILTLVQKSPRENYKLTETTPLQPGTTFPNISRGGTETLAASDKSGLLYSGEEAMSGLADRLTSADSPFKDKLVEGQSSPYIADTLSYQAEVVKSGQNGNFSFTHKVVPENTVVFRTADGGALVLGRINFGFEGTPKAAGDKLSIGDDAAALAGGKETTTGMVLSFAESMAVYVPPAGSTDPMKLVAATRGLVGASFK